MSIWAEERPSEDFYRILAPDGSLERDPPEVDDETLLRFYETFVLTRTLEERVQRLQRRGELSIQARSKGEEATAIGSAAALEAEDWIFPSYRQNGALLYWGVPIGRALASLMGAAPETVDEHLPVDPSEAPPVNITPVYVPLAVNVTNAVGSAMADVYNGTDHVSLSYIGDGSTSQGDFHEALNFAGVFDAPAVTVIQNNQWAISVPAHRQTASETFAQKGAAHGVPYDRVDGNDVLAVFEKTREAVQRARDGDGPTLIECVTYRLVEHNTADEPSVYRNEDQRAYWEDRDPLDRFDTFLRDRGLLDDDRTEAVQNRATQQVDAGIAAAQSVPATDPQRMFDHHLHTETWTEQRQRAELAAEREGRNPFLDFTGEGLE